jgi:hypothetical protein
MDHPSAQQHFYGLQAVSTCALGLRTDGLTRQRHVSLSSDRDRTREVAERRSVPEADIIAVQ